MKNGIKKLALLLLSFSISYADLVTVEGDITTDVVWTADNTYYLNNQAFVKDGVTLTIEAGTEIVGRYDANYSADNPAPCLVVEQGGKVMAQGTADAPITFRSELSEDDPNYGNGRGLWGGLIVNGYAPIANEGGTAAVEGLTGVLYGGSDPDDNSGVLRYVRVWNGGSSIAPDNEINGITLAGVGRGTTVEYCEVALNLDDGFEMFGGTVDLKYCSAVSVGDDAFDTDAGYQGRGQFLLVVRADDSDKGHEMDSKTNGDLDSQPRSHPHFTNVTVISSVAHGADALRLREGTGGDFRNYIIHGANDGVRNDDNGSEVVTQDLAEAAAAGHPDFLYVSGSMVMNGLGGDPWDDFDEATDGTWTGTYVMESAGLTYTVDANGLPATLDVTPSADGSAYEGVDDVIEDDFFVPTYYKGAFGSANWLEGWSYLDEAGILFEQEEAVTLLGGNLTEDTYLAASGTYYLNQQLFVKDGVTLTIEAGTEILGRYDANYSADNPAPCLVVEQGGKVMAQGTADAPITFRSELSEDDPNYGNGRGLWGGLIVNGYAPIANEGGTAAVEGLTGVLYGGSDPDDNSGVLRYVRVWNGGSSIAPDNEINGITLAGVGRGTTVEYCEVALNLDDGFEMFGGTVDLKYCSAVSVGDDAFDTDAGYQGRGQFLLVVRADDSDKGHEMDSKTNGDLDSQPRSHPHFANVTVISSVAHGEDALRLREGTGGDFRNYIIHGANDGVRNDDNGSEVVTQDLAEAAAAGHPDFLYISGSMVMNGLADVPWDDFDEATDGAWTGTYAMESAGLTYTVDANGLPATLDVTPSADGSAYEGVDTVIEDDFFVPTYYKGAFGSANWLEGWSYLDEAGILFEQEEAVTLLGGNLTEDTYLAASGTYYLNQQLFVKDGVTLTIEAGTEILGRYDANYSADNPAPCLVVEQGGKVMAQGTADAPITFRSELSEDDPNYGNGRGLWGGLIINGYAPIANEGGTAAVEGLTGVLYGGSDPDDNSGVLRYVRVWNGGSSIAPDNEINGITLAGVGRGTTVEYCEVALNLDDGFEMFGGTVDLKYCSAVSVGDDAFDTDAGYQGRGQFLLVVRADDSDKGHEMDSKTNGDLDSQPRSHPHFTNVTVISSVAHGEDALRLREGTGGDFRNYIIHGANDGVRNDDNGSEVVTQDLAEAAAAGHPDFLYISGSMVMNGLADVPWDDFDEATDGPWTGTYVMESAGLTYTVDANGLPATLDVTPSADGSAYEGVDTVIEDDFFVPTYYKGAFGSANWLEGWSYLDEAGILFEQEEAVTLLGGNLTEDTYLAASGTYYLNQQLFVKDGVTLTIEAGTEILGRYDANYSADNPAPCLVVEQGGKVMAQGTADAPITFRSELSEDDPNYGNGRGLWGGLIINGYAPIANEGGTAAVEGLTGVLYGGSDPDDNSGVLRYVRVWNGGSSIAPDNEINGITLAGVGRGTTVEYCEVALNLDDGFEMFGGTVDLKYCSAVSVGDDAFDTDAGYQGRGQFLLVVRADDSDKGHEMDSKTNGDLDSQPRSHPHFTNVTVISSVAHGEDALRLREGTGGDFRNYIIHGANDGVRNDDNGSEVVTQDLAEAAAAGHPDFLYISGSMVMNGLADVPWDDFDEATDGPWTGTYVMESAGLTYTVDANGLPATLDVTPSADGSAYQDVDTVIEDDFFVQTDYKGAFPSNANWLDGWSYLSDAGILLSADNNSPAIVADKITLHGNYPNPFNPSTEIAFELGQDYKTVELTVFNMVGQSVYEVSMKDMVAGFHQVTWNGSSVDGKLVPSGLYLYRISTETKSVIGKMTLLK